MITPVILCGGSGTRLWPVSRKAFPKQFSPLLGAESLFQTTLRRLSGPLFGAPILMTGADFRFLATDQARTLGLADATTLIEPCPRNTAPAVLTAALHLAGRDGAEALMLVAPSDHVLGDRQAFGEALAAGAEAARAGRLVTFGITPDRAETGYGYLALESAPEAGRATPLTGFVEKPEAARAAEMLAAGTFLWNAGIFLFRAGDIIAAFEAHAPDLVAPCRAALDTATPDLDFLRLGGAAWDTLPDISVDYAVMEKAETLSVVPYAGGWSDLGAWDALWALGEKDADGVVATGPAAALGCRNTLLRAEDPDQALVGLGLDGIVAVAMRDAVLVADMGASQKVKEVVTALRRADAPQADAVPRHHRPWGWYETLCLGARFQVKRIMVKPGGVLSLQSHHHRSEHWVVVEGTAKVTLGEEARLLTENQSIYIPLGAVHRMENPGKLDMYLIEVQTGSYLGEDDIVRYEDIYARASDD